MVLAVGAASLALDAIKSLTSSSSSQPPGAFGPVLSDITGSSSRSTDATAVSGFSSTQISADNFNALLNSQSATSANSADASDADSSTSDSSQTQSASTAASSTYNAINQLTQSTVYSLGLNPFSSSA